MGVALDQDANFIVSPIPQGFDPFAINCIAHRFEISMSSNEAPIPAHDMLYDSTMTMGGAVFNGLYTNRPLGVGENLDVSRPDTADRNNSCGAFIEQFGEGDGSDGCLLFSIGATCVHFWLEAPSD